MPVDWRYKKKMEKVVQQQAQLSLAHEAVMLADTAKVLAQSRKIVAKHTGVDAGNGKPVAESEEMIHIGDRYEEVAKSSPVGGAILKGLLGAGLLATGVGAPVGAWLISDAIRSAKPVVEKVVETVVTDVEEWDSSVKMKVRPPQPQ